MVLALTRATPMQPPRTRTPTAPRKSRPLTRNPRARTREFPGKKLIDAFDVVAER